MSNHIIKKTLLIMACFSYLADLWRDKCVLTFLVTTKDELFHNGVHI